jgi:VanZ family protein
MWTPLLRLGKLTGAVLGLALVYTLYEAFKPANSGGGLFPWDKADHFSAFFVLTGLAMVAFARQPLWRIATAMAILGAAIELIQGLPFVGRDCDFWDWVAELCAIAAVYAVVLAAKMRRTFADRAE